MKIISSVLALCLAVSAALFGQALFRASGGCCTYYVSNSGSDAASGKTPATAWQTIAKVNSSTFNPGDNVLFKAGDTWREQLNVPSSGASGTPITFGTYSSGAAPSIDESNLVGAWSAVTSASSGSVSQTNTKLSTATGTAFVDFNGTGGVTLSNYIGDEITICSVTSSSQCVSGYIKASGTAETYGSQLLANTAFNNTSSLNLFQSTVSSIASGSAPGGHYLQVTLTSSSPGNASEPFTATTGGVYLGSAYMDDGTSAQPGLGIQENGGSFSTLQSTFQNPSTWTKYSIYATADMTNMAAVFTTYGSSGQTALYASSSVTQVLTPSATGVTITSASGGSTYNWTSVSSNFNLNDPEGYTYTISGTVPNVWQTPVVAQPNQIALNGTINNTPTSSLVALTSLGQWHASAAYLYTYDAVNPSSTYPSAWYSARNYGISLNGQQYITINGLEAKNANQYGIYDSGSGSAGNISGLTLTNSTADHNYKSGFYVNVTSQNYTMINLTFASNTFSYNGASGLSLASIPLQSGVKITNNISEYNAQMVGNVSTTDFAYNAGIHMYCNGGNGPSLISGNLVIDNGSTQTSTSWNSQGVGIWSDTCNDVNVTDNYIANNFGPGIYFEVNNSSTAAYNVLTGNGIYDSVSGGGDTSATGQLCVVADTSVNIAGDSVFNNTIYGGWIGLKVYTNSTGLLSNTTVENNIAVAATSHNFWGGAGGANDGTHGSGNIYTHNDFGPAATNFINWGGTNYATYAAWEAAAGNCGIVGCSNSMQQDPLLSNPSGGDFTLETGSPAIGAGVYIPGVSTANPPNIGAK